MKRIWRIIVGKLESCAALALLLIMSHALPVSAQEYPPPPVDFELPAAVPTPPSFPELPPSRPCNAKDPLGPWRLVRVYESPTGAESAGFARNQFQYLSFDPTSVVGNYSSTRNDLPVPQILQKMQDQNSQALEQFTFKSGFLYFYKKGRATDTMACFIVANPKGTFRPGQMLLMPPREQIVAARRLAKVYERVQVPRPASAAAAQPNAAARPAATGAPAPGPVPAPPQLKPNPPKR